MKSAQNLTPLASDRLINVHEAAALANRKEVTIYNAANPKVGRLHAIRAENGTIMFKESEVKEVFSEDRRGGGFSRSHTYKTSGVYDFDAVIKREAEALLGKISVMEATLNDMKEKYKLVEPLYLKILK